MVSVEAAKRLDVIVNTLKENKNYKLEVYSHTDSKGNDAANQTLSEKNVLRLLWNTWQQKESRSRDCWAKEWVKPSSLTVV